MSRVVFPFNHQPVAGVYRNGASYTVTSGRYARVNLQIYVHAKGTPALVAVSDATIETHNVVLEYWLVDGQVIDVTLSNASATTGSVTSGYIGGTTSATVTINGNTVAIAKADAAAWHSGTTGTSTVTGASSYSMYIEEYNQIT